MPSPPADDRAAKAPLRSGVRRVSRAGPGLRAAPDRESRRCRRRPRRHIPDRLAAAGRPATEPAARLWLYGVARRVLANHHRGQRRRSALADRLRADLAHSYQPPQFSGELAQIAQAFRRLPGAEQEVLALSAWEGLDPGPDRDRAGLLAERGPRPAAPGAQAARPRTGRQPRPPARPPHPRPEWRPGMNPVTRISPVTDAEAARMARPETLADLAGQITAMPPRRRRAGWRRAAGLAVGQEKAAG